MKQAMVTRLLPGLSKFLRVARSDEKGTIRRPPSHELHLFPQVLEDEIYLVSFPRSGNTWLRCLLTTIFTGSEVTPKLLQDVVPDVYQSLNTHTAKPNRQPLIIKTHAPYRAIPARVIYLVRDGRRALESFFRYARQYPSGFYDDHSRIQDFYFRDDLWPCPWHVHVTGWLDGLSTWDQTRYLIVRYEDLVASPGETLRSVLRFTGCEVSDGDIGRALDLNSRNRLRQIEEAAGTGSMNFIATPDAHASTRLSASDLERYEARARSTLARLGYIPP
jgi:hypothetical protein